MVDQTSLEVQALEAVLRFLDDVAEEIRRMESLSWKSRETLNLIEKAMNADRGEPLTSSSSPPSSSSAHPGASFAGESLSNPTQKEFLPMTLDFNHYPNSSILSDKINRLIDAALQNKNSREKPRDYLGASRLGVACSRALQYEFTQTPRDNLPSGELLRTFEIGHAFEKMALAWLRGAGFTIVTHNSNHEPFGFSTAGGRIQGHVDGIIVSALSGFEVACPALWECKSMNARSWKQTVEKGMRIAKPIYAVQIALYQAYMADPIANRSTVSIHQNPALFTAVNKDTSEIYHELVPFDAALAQEASDRAVQILRATEAKETLPRISRDPDHPQCRYCSWRDSCWQEVP